MREVLSELTAIRDAGGTAAMATVVRTWRSAPRPAGASMLVSDAGEAVGSVSGGCVEGALYELGQEVLADGLPRYETYGVSDDDAFAVGLTCGGILEVFVERVDDAHLARARRSRQQHRGRGAGGRRDDRARAALRRTAPGRAARPHRGQPRHRSSRRHRARGRHRPARLRHDGLPALRARGRAARRGPRRLRRLVRAAAADVRLRCHRLLRGAGQGGQVPRLPRHRRATPGRSSPPASGSRTPTRSSSTGRTAGWSSSTSIRARSSACSPTTPSSTCPRSPSPCAPMPAYIGAMGSRRTHEDRLVRLKEAGLTDDELAPAALADRARPRRAHAGGDRDLDRGRDRAGALGRQRRPPREHGRPDPPRRAPVTW